jgi:hypothetical protein
MEKELCELKFAKRRKLMCLLTIDKRFDPPDPKERTAYKSVLVQSDGILTPYTNDKIQYNTWTKAVFQSKWSQNNGKDEITIHRTKETYPTGFHVYATKQSANRYKFEYDTVIKVKIRNIVCYGQDGTIRTTLGKRQPRVLVAQEIYIPKEQ